MVAARVRAWRAERGWTLDALAARSGVSRRMLVSIEQGAANPSIGTLLRISDALGVGLPSLVAEESAPALRVTRAGEGSVLWRGEGGGQGVLVIGTEPPDVFEMWDWALAPGDSRSGEAHVAGARELLLVLAGAVEVQAGRERAVLDAGDAATFFGDEPHSYRNPGSETARFVMAVFESHTRQGGTR